MQRHGEPGQQAGGVGGPPLGGPPPPRPVQVRGSFLGRGVSRDPPIVRCGVSVGRCGWGGACPRPSDHLVAFCSVRPAPRAGWCGAGGCSVQSGRRAQPEGCRGGNGRPGGPSLGARAARVPPGCPPGGWRSRAAGLGPSRGAAAWTELRAGRRPGGAGVWSTGSERGAGRGGRPQASVCPGRPRGCVLGLRA